MPEKDFLKAFRYDLTTKTVKEAPAVTAAGSLAKPPADGMPGGYSSLSANGAKSGIVWTLMPNGDAQWNLTPGRMAAFDALTLKQIWADPDNYSFAKAVPPTIADGKVIRATASVPPNASADLRLVAVYGFGNAGGPEPRPSPKKVSSIQACYTIQEKYANYGGPLSILGNATGPESRLDDPYGGMSQEFRGHIFGMTTNNTSVPEMPGAPMPTCSVPMGMFSEVRSTIYYTQRTCANVVQGEIRDFWLKAGGPKSKFGYPVADETNTPDHRGRMSRFEHGEIWWYPSKGAYEQRGRD
jgi:hypothetical protein